MLPRCSGRPLGLRHRGAHRPGTSQAKMIDSLRRLATLFPNGGDSSRYMAWNGGTTGRLGLPGWIGSSPGHRYGWRAV
jgi:hypothetical protein